MLAVVGKNHFDRLFTPTSLLKLIIIRLRLAFSLAFLPILLFKGLVELRGVLNWALPSFPLFLWFSGSTSVLVRRSVSTPDVASF